MRHRRTALTCYEHLRLRSRIDGDRQLAARHDEAGGNIAENELNKHMVGNRVLCDCSALTLPYSTDAKTLHHAVKQTNLPKNAMRQELIVDLTLCCSPITHRLLSYHKQVVIDNLATTN